MSRTAIGAVSICAICAALAMLWIGYDLLGSGWSSERRIGGTLIYVWLVPFIGGLGGLVRCRRTS